MTVAPNGADGDERAVTTEGFHVADQADATEREKKYRMQ